VQATERPQPQPRPAFKDLAKANHRWPGNSNDETARGKNDTTITVKVLDHDGNELKIPRFQ
jgi:hypothetical protein